MTKTATSLATPPIVYLHGFASSPLAHKAAFFREKLAEYGLSLQVPDLNLPSFEGLTLSAQVALVQSLLDELCAAGPPPVLIGSSLGALVTLLALSTRPDGASRALLLSPALRFVGAPLARALGTSLETWERDGFIHAPHPAGGIHRLRFDLVRDARTYDFAALTPTIPLLIVHGTQDELVPIDSSRAFVSAHAGVELIAIEGGDHGLVAAMDTIWERTKDFVVGR